MEERLITNTNGIRTITSPQPATAEAQRYVLDTVNHGEIVIDATAGNGFDTLFLARLVGPAGQVYAFDIQEEALTTTSGKLQRAGLNNVVLLKQSHAELISALPANAVGSVGAIMMNLGYLPGGSKERVTCRDTTIAAVRQSVTVLRPGGVLTVVGYTGHPGGRDETDAVRTLLANELSRRGDKILEVTAPGQRTNPPVLFVVSRQTE